MSARTGVVLALAAPGADDGLRSRLSTYLHPLAGRPLAWHAVQAVATHTPGRVCVAAGPELVAEHFGDLPGGARVVSGGVEGVGAALAVAPGARVLVVDALAPTVGVGLPPLLEEAEDAFLVGEGGEVLAASLGAEGAAALARCGFDLTALAADLPGVRRHCDARVFSVRSRAGLARAAASVRDRVVGRLMEEGVTFLLPDSVLVDVGVSIGRDTVVYPGVVIEGETTIGAETVVGPGCRIVASRVGSGVELKGFNYISHTTIRNRAILEAYVRRGYDA